MAKRETYHLMASVILAGVIIALGLVYSTVLYSTQAKAGENPFVTVSASGVAYGVPSQANLYVIVNGTGNTTALATSNLSMTLEAFNNTIAPFIHSNLTRMGSRSYSLNKIYNKTGYVATETMVVTIPELSNASAAIGSLALTPNIYISNIVPALSDWQQSALRSSALTAALQNATMQAMAIAPEGAQLTVRNVSVDSYVTYPLFSSVSAADFRSSSASSNPLIFGGQGKVVEHVSVIFSYS